MSFIDCCERKCSYKMWDCHVVHLYFPLYMMKEFSFTVCLQMKAYKAECTNSGSRLEAGAFVGKIPVISPNFCLQSFFGLFFF